MPKHSADIVFTVPAVDGFKVRGVSAKTGRKYRLAEVTFEGDMKFFMSVAEQMIDAVEAADGAIRHADKFPLSKPEDVDAFEAARTDRLKRQLEFQHTVAPQSDPKVVDEFETALTDRLKKAVRELFGGPIAAGK